MTTQQWLVVSERAWRLAHAATEQGDYEDARFWLARWRLAAHYARRAPT